MVSVVALSAELNWAGGTICRPCQTWLLRRRQLNSLGQLLDGGELNSQHARCDHPRIWREHRSLVRCCDNAFLLGKEGG